MMPGITGTHIIRLDETDSTNDYISELLKMGDALESGTLVVTDFQKKGRGFGDHTWESEPGRNLLLSIYFKPFILNSHHQFYLNMAVALGVQSFIKSIVQHHNVTVKWPNDLYINDKKAGGLLLQHTVSGFTILHSIIGIGLNINQLRFMSDAPNPVSLRHYLDHDLDLEECLVGLCSQLDRHLHMLEQKEFQSIKSLYHSALYAREVLRKYRYGDELIEARIKGISDYGSLILERTDGMKIECDMHEIQFITQR